MKRPLLSPEEITSSLATLDGWAVEGNELVKTFKFPAYLAGIDFVSKLGQAAEAMNHHPDLLVGWRKVTVKLSTHSVSGLTELDVTLATAAEKIVTSQVVF